MGREVYVGTRTKLEIGSGFAFHQIGVIFWAAAVFKW